jgi:3-deoxy-D-manno-octulosonate 8-phosphate phosphatase (KDO 8-P phosphatase)
VKHELRQIALKFQDKLKPIKVALFDIDGVLTDGTIHYDGAEMGFNRSTHTHDGYGMKMLMASGLKVGVISGGDSLGIIKRFQENLSLDYVFLGNEDKREAYNKILNEGYKPDEILYVADEFFDLPLLMRSGFSACPPSSVFEVRSRVDYVTANSSGHGCAREVMELLRLAQGWAPEVLDFDGTPIDFKKDYQN